MIKDIWSFLYDLLKIYDLWWDIKFHAERRVCLDSQCDIAVFQWQCTCHGLIFCLEMFGRSGAWWRAAGRRGRASGPRAVEAAPGTRRAEVAAAATDCESWSGSGSGYGSGSGLRDSWEKMFKVWGRSKIFWVKGQKTKGWICRIVNNYIFKSITLR